MSETSQTSGRFTNVSEVSRYPPSALSGWCNRGASFNPHSHTERGYEPAFLNLPK